VVSDRSSTHSLLDRICRSRVSSKVCLRKQFFVDDIMRAIEFVKMNEWCRVSFALQRKGR